MICSQCGKPFINGTACDRDAAYDVAVALVPLLTDTIEIDNKGDQWPAIIASHIRPTFRRLAEVEAAARAVVDGRRAQIAHKCKCPRCENIYLEQRCEVFDSAIDALAALVTKGGGE